MEELVERPPTVAEYQRLRASAGWYAVTDEAAQRGLDSALYSVCAVQDEEVIGCGRVVGDGGMYFYLQDVIVLPAHQGEGIGRAITARLMAFVESRATPGSFVGLMAAKGVSGFYERFGFAARATDAPGMFRVMR